MVRASRGCHKGSASTRAAAGDPRGGWAHSSPAGGAGSACGAPRGGWAHPSAARGPDLVQCAPEPPRVMSRLRLWVPLLLLTWQSLCLLVQAAQPPEWALDPAQLTADLLGPTEPWSSHSSEFPPESPQVLTPPAEPGGFHYLGSSAPAQMLALPKELTETLVPFPDTDSVGELPPEADQDLNDKLTQLFEGFPEVEAQAQHPEPPEEIETSPIQQGSPSPPPEILKEAVNPQEAPAEPSKPSKERVPQPTAHEVNVPSLSKKEAQWPNFNVTVKPVDLVLTVTLTQPPERTEEAQASPTQQEAPAQPVERPEEAVPTPVQLEAPGEPLELPEEAGPTPVQPEVPAWPAELPEEAGPTPAQPETLAQPVERPEEAGPSPVQQEAPTLVPDVTHKSADVELTITPEPAKEVGSSTAQQEAPPQPPEHTEEAEPSPTQQETSAQPPEAVQPSSHHHVQYLNLPNVSVKPADVQVTITPESTTEVGPLPVQDEAAAQPSVPLNVEPFAMQHEAPTLPPQSPEEAEPLSVQQETPTESPESTTQEKPPIQQETPVQHPEYPGEVNPPTTQQEALAQQSQSPEEAEHSTALQQTLSLPEDPEVTLPHPEHVQAQQPHLTEVTAQPLDLELTVNPEPTTEFEHSTALKKTTAPPKDLEVTFAHLEQVQTQHPTLAEVTVQPLDLGLTITPEFTKETELSLPRRGTPIQPPEPPKEVVVAQSPVYQEEIVQTPGQDQAQHPSSPNVTVQPLDLELTVSPEPTKEVEQFTTLKKTTSPPKDLEVTLAHSEQVQSHRPTLTKVTVKPLDLELTITPESAAEVEPSPAMPEIPDQHPEPTKELVSQPHIYQEAAVPTPHQDQAQHWWSPNVTVQPLDLELTITPESTTEVKQSTTLQQTTTPPKDLEVTFPQSEQVQVQHPTLNKVTVKPLDLGLTITPEPTTETETSPTMQETP
ncbi:leucine-rich repeat-containing protein 37A3-like, partial [Callorhinus ursinus]|uniref:leucine-rich repeat-containing protein 37A3-like n=1 Tax=Callorhinus ursinus TaxID=34884 RepID=UPI003CD035FA